MKKYSVVLCFLAILALSVVPSVKNLMASTEPPTPIQSIYHLASTQPPTPLTEAIVTGTTC